MRIGDTLRLAFAGTRADLARVSMTALGAATAVLVLLCCASVLTVAPNSGRYRSRLFEHEVLLGNVALAMLLFAVPVLFFVAQCARLGAPGRNRRLAAFRMAGATPAQVRRIVGMEAGVAATIGAAIGATGYLAGRKLLDKPGTDGLRNLPTDVLPAAEAIVAVSVGVPILTVLLTVVLLRRVTITPLGVWRRATRQQVRAWPGLLGVVGLVGLTTFGAIIDTEYGRSVRGLPEFLLVIWVLSCTVLLMLGLTLGTAWIGHVGARLLLRITRRPSALIAARLTLADPYEGSRTYAVIQVLTAFGTAAMLLFAWLRTNVAVRTAAELEWTRRYGGEVMDFSGTAAFRAEVFSTTKAALLALTCIAALTLLVALVESGAARRRTLAALVAAGTPRAVLARALCWRVLIPAVPGIAAAAVAGTLAMRPVTRTAGGGQNSWGCTGSVEHCNDSANWEPREVRLEFAVPLPWADLAGVAAVALLTVLVVVGVSALLQRNSFNPTELRTD